ncbi:MAG: Wzz/FepE/Etk N-terminal domain-containing protein [bacterium]|nr:Wzz/FepE/Etk N-terminal domain-containing protein [bacterium]
MKFFANIQENWRSIVLVTLLTLSLSVIVTFIQPFEFSSTFSLLVIEKNPNLDAFSAAKSAERLSQSLGQVLYTTSFYDKVLNSGYVADNVGFSNDEQKRREQWKRQIDTQVFADVGVLKITVYDADRDNASDLANALAVVLAEDGTEYLGGGNSIELKVVDYPLTSKNPMRPNVPVNLAAGLLLGLGGSIGYFVARDYRARANTPGQGAEARADNTEHTTQANEANVPDKNQFLFESFMSVPKPGQEVEEIKDIPERQKEWAPKEEEYRNFE